MRTVFALIAFLHWNAYLQSHSHGRSSVFCCSFFPLDLIKTAGCSQTRKLPENHICLMWLCLNMTPSYSDPGDTTLLPAKLCHHLCSLDLLGLSLKGCLHRAPPVRKTVPLVGSRVEAPAPSITARHLLQQMVLIDDESVPE